MMRLKLLRAEGDGGGVLMAVRSKPVHSLLLVLLALSCGLTEAAQHLRASAGQVAESGRRDPVAGAEAGSAAPLFLTEADIPSYRAAIEKYLTAKGCLSSSSDQLKDSVAKRRSFPTCAVVGASPNSEASKAGRDIDNHSAVFRAGICDAPSLKRHWEDIGEKTTYCVTFDLKKDLATDAKSIMPLTTWQFLRNFDAIASSNSSDSSCKDHYLLLHPRELSRWEAKLTSLGRTLGVDLASWRKRSKYYDPDCLASSKTSEPSKCPKNLGLSSGFDAVLLALELCRSVDVYGFDTDDSSDAPYGHLHNSVRSVGASCRMADHSHPFPLERRFLKAWNDKGIIKLHSSTLQPSRQGAQDEGRGQGRGCGDDEE